MIYELSRKASRQIEAIIRYTDKHFGKQQTEGLCRKYPASVNKSHFVVNLRSQCIKQFCGTPTISLGRFHLTFPEHGHEFNAC